MVGGKGAHWNRRLWGAGGPVPLALRAADQCPETSECSEGHLTGGSLVSALHLSKQRSACCEDHVSRYLVPGTQGKAVLKPAHTDRGPRIRAITWVPSTGDSEGHVGLLQKCCLCSGKSRRMAQCQPETDRVEGKEPDSITSNMIFTKGFLWDLILNAANIGNRKHKNQ